MRRPLIFARIDVEFGAEGMRVLLPLGARVDERALVMAERATVEIALDEIRAHERPQPLEEPAEAGRGGIIAPQRMALLEQVDQRDQQDGEGDDERPQRPTEIGRASCRERVCQYG